MTEAKKQFHTGRKTAEGIYIGQYAPRDREGNDLYKIFNVFAAPQDLGGRKNYFDTIEHIARLKNWHGFDGASYATDKELYKAIKDGSYAGGWIIPTSDIMIGKDVDFQETTPDNLYAYRRSFGAAADPERAFKAREWYWSCTEFRASPFHMKSIVLSGGDESWSNKHTSRLNCRPVRLVPVTAP